MYRECCQVPSPKLLDAFHEEPGPFSVLPNLKLQQEDLHIFLDIATILLLPGLGRSSFPKT